MAPIVSPYDNFSLEINSHSLNMFPVGPGVLASASSKWQLWMASIFLIGTWVRLFRIAKLSLFGVFLKGSISNHSIIEELED